MISAVTGVLLTPDEAEFIVGGFDEFTRMLAERRSQPSPRLARTVEQLRRATRKCGGPNANDTQNATNGRSSQADEADTAQDVGYATVTTAEAARILGVVPTAVRAQAQRDPSKFGSVRIRGRWHHNRERIEHYAIRKGRIVRSPPASNQGV